LNKYIYCFLFIITLSSKIYAQPISSSSISSLKTSDLCGAQNKYPDKVDEINAELCKRGGKSCVTDGLCVGGKYAPNSSANYIFSRQACLKSMGAVISKSELDDCMASKLFATKEVPSTPNQANLNSDKRVSKSVPKNDLPSEEDLICQSNGIKPKTPAFAECKIRVATALRDQKLKDQERRSYEDQRRLQETEQRIRVEAHERRLALQAENAKRELESRCNSLRLSTMGQTKSKYWYDSVNAGTEAYERCMMGMPPVERPKPTTTDCQRVGFDDFRCTTK
jgi:hypothetical protein